MGSIHSELVGDELHIARTFVSTGDPNGVVTPGIIGEFYWDSDANQLYVAESLLNTSWVHSGSEFDQFIELLDTPNSYSGQAGFSLQVNLAEDGLEFGQALDIINSPSFANLTLQPISGDADFIIKDSSSVLKFDIQYNSTLDVIDIQSQVGLLLRSAVGGLAINTDLGDLILTSLAGDIRMVADGNFFINTDDIFVDSSTGFVGLGSASPLAQLFISSLLNDTVPVSMQQSLGSNGARIKTLVGDRDPEGNVTGDPGDHYWRVNGLNSDLFIKTTVSSNTGWQSVLETTGFDEFIELTDTPADYTSSNNFVVQVNQAGNALVFGQALRPVDGPVFNGLELQQIASEDVSFLIIDSFPLTQFKIQLDDSENKIIIDSVLDLNITTSNGLEINAEGPASINVPNNALAINTNNADFSKNLNISGRLEVVNTIAPVLSSVLFDAGNIASGQSIFILGEYAYFVVADFDRLLILDVSDPTATPVIIGSLVDSVNMDSPRFIVVIATLAYIASANSNSLTIVDVSDSTNPFIVGQISDAVLLDSATSVYVVGKFAYVTAQTSDSLVIIDISDPKTPQIVGSLVDSVNLERAAEVVVLDKFAYVVSFTSKSLSIIDISNSTNPTLTGVLIDVVNLNGASSLTVNGGFAYIAAAASDMLTIVDITDPSNPTLAGTLVDSVNLNGARGITVAGKFAYISSGVGRSLTVIDISDPTNPVLTSVLFDSVNLSGARMPFISGKFAYVPAFNSFSIIDIHGIDASTASLGNIQSTNISTTRDAFIKGNLFAGALNVGDRGIHSDGDISNKGALDVVPSQPKLLASLTDGTNLNGAIGLFIVNNYAYVVSRVGNSLTILDITEPTAPIILSTLIDAVNLVDTRSLYISGKYAYIPSFDNDSLVIVDISNVFAPVFISSLIDGTTMNGAISNYVAGKFCYVLGRTSNSFAIVDISDPFTPVLVGSLIDGVNFVSPNNIYILGKFAYVTQEGNRLTIVDISDPTSPTIAGSLTDNINLNSPGDIYVVGRYAYITGAGGDSLAIIDVSDPTSPTLISAVSDSVLLDQAFAVSIDGNYAYIGTSSSSARIVIIDISDPTSLVIIQSFLIGFANIRDIYVSGKFAYVVGNTSNTFAVIDLNGIDASTASIGNIKTGYLSVDNEIVAKGITYSGGFNAGPHGVHSDGDISGLTSFSTFDKGDQVALSRLENTGANPGRSEKFVGNRNPLLSVIGLGGDIYYRADGLTSGSYENKSLTTGNVWFKRSAKPSAIVEINTFAEFEELATGGIITVGFAIELTIIFNIKVTTTSRFVVDFGGSLNITGADQATVGINYTGSGDLFSGSGNLRIFGGIDLDGSPAGTKTLMNITGGLVDVNLANFDGWSSLGSVSNGIFLLRFLNMSTVDAGFTLINAAIISVFNVAHIGISGMAAPMFTVNTNNPLSIMSFSEIKHNVTSTGSVFDLKSTINFDGDLIDINHVAAEEVPANITAPIFKQTVFSVITINSVISQTPGSGTITSESDNGAGGTTILHPLSTFSDGEIVTIVGTTNYNGTFQIFNVVPITSFDIIRVFTVNDGAVGSISSERIAFITPGGHGVISGQPIKVLGTNFYNRFYTALLVGATSISVNATFISTNTGTMERDLSLDETDFRVNAKDCVGIPNSLFLASAFVNNNVTVTPVSGIFGDLLFGTVGNALIASTRMAKWRMTNEINGTFELISDVIFDGWINFETTVPDLGGILDIRIKFQIDKGSGFVDLDDPVELFASFDANSSDKNMSKTFPVKAVKGDLIKPQVTRDAGVGSPVFSYYTMNIKQS